MRTAIEILKEGAKDSYHWKDLLDDDYNDEENYHMALREEGYLQCECCQLYEGPEDFLSSGGVAGEPTICYDCELNHPENKLVKEAVTTIEEYS